MLKQTDSLYWAAAQSQIPSDFFEVDFVHRTNNHGSAMCTVGKCFIELSRDSSHEAGGDVFQEYSLWHQETEGWQRAGQGIWQGRKGTCFFMSFLRVGPFRTPSNFQCFVSLQTALVLMRGGNVFHHYPWLVLQLLLWSHSLWSQRYNWNLFLFMRRGEILAKVWSRFCPPEVVALFKHFARRHLECI